MLSQDEIRARSLRLSGRAPNPYTGTLNDPFQQAQSNYAGPGWGQFFGGLQKEQEDAELAGKNYRVNWGGFGNAVDDGGGMPRPRGLSLGAMTAADLNPLEEQAQKRFLLQQQANEAIERAKAEKLAQQARVNAEANRVNGELAKSYDDFVLSSAFVPASPITRGPDTSKFADAVQGLPPTHSYESRPTNAPMSNEMLLNSVPGHMRPALEKSLAEMALKRQEAQLAADKEKEVAKHNRATEAAANPFAVPVSEGGAAATGAQALTGEDFLKTLPAGTQAQIKGLAEGSQPFPTGMSYAKLQPLIQAVSQYDPTFDATNYNGRNKARTDLMSPSGTGGKTINAVNTAASHLGKLSDAIERLDNTNYSTVNAVENIAGKLTGSTKATNFEVVQPQAMKEIERLWRGAGGSQSDIDALKSSLSTNMGKQQQREALATFSDLLMGKLESTRQQRDNALGPVASKKIPVLFDKNKPVLQQIYKRAGLTAPGELAGESVGAPGGQIVVTAPDGSSHPFATQAQADEFKRRAGIR